MLSDASPINAILTGRICVDAKGYPFIYFSKSNLDVLKKGTEYTLMVLGEIDTKKVIRDKLSIIQKR